MTTIIVQMKKKSPRWMYHIRTALVINELLRKSVGD